MSALYKLREYLMKIIGACTAFLFTVMVVVGSWQIISRYVFNSPSTVSEELLTYTFAWMALLASAYVFGKNDHMRMAFLADQVKGTPKIVMELIIQFLVFAFAAIVMVYGGIAITKLTMTQVTASLQIPMGYVYFMVPISGVLIMYFSLLNALDVLKKDHTKEGK
ncbi:MAG: TRAP transporter small permease [Eubacteriales bacterium]|nr:TRAP transporter small permease [Eubacteriales bacterium]